MNNSSINWRFRRGFTLIELLVVISIIGYWPACFCRLASAKQKVKVAQAKTEIKSRPGDHRLLFQNTPLSGGKPARDSVTINAPISPTALGIITRG
jgi:prepilin-type N-terminal cleavage/methylation domain-containing protein